MSNMTIRQMINAARASPFNEFTKLVGGVVFKAWPNGHVRVDGVHRTIANAECDLYEAGQVERHGKCWRACPDMLCDDCKVERGLV